MSEPIDLAAQRALRADDNRMWTPAQMLRDVADKLERGELKADRAMVILSTARDEKGQTRYQTYVMANMSGEQSVACAAYALRDLPEL